MIMHKWVIDQEQRHGEQEGERVRVRGTGTEIWQYPNSPRFLPPCQDINSHKSEKITMHECKKHDQE